MTQPARLAAARVVVLFIVSPLAGAAAARAPELVMPGLPRVIEPRLSLTTRWQQCTAARENGRTLETLTCGTTHIPVRSVSIIEMCSVQSLAEAVTTLATSPQCADAVVKKLSAVARLKSRDARVLSDLSAAYYTRAYQLDRPSDLVRALDAAERAVDVSPDSREALFNRALAMESLGLADDAIASWDQLRRSDSSEWAKEAAERWQRLVRSRAREAATQWPLNLQRLPDAIRLGDGAAVSVLISPFRSTAQRYVEADVLAAWARAAIAGQMEEAEWQLKVATTVSSELSRLTGDRYLVDVVNRIRSARSPSALAALKSGHLAYGNAVAAERSLQFDAAEPLSIAARDALRAAGSPLWLGAELNRAVDISPRGGESVAMALKALPSVETRANRAGYRCLVARVHSTRALFLIRQSRYLDALVQYDAAREIYERVNDAESAGGTHYRIAGVLRTIGQKELMWREVVPVLRDLPGFVDAQARHVALGEIALSAASLGYPNVALRYQNAAVRLLEDALSAPGNGQTKPLDRLRKNLGIARRARAVIHLLLHDYDEARADIETAVPLMGQNDRSTQAAMDGLLAEVRGQSAMLRQDAAGAIRAFTEALEITKTTQYLTYYASLHIQRAEAYRLAGNSRAAEEDLSLAIADLHDEEQRVRGVQWTPFWSGYFSRFQESYRRLIRLLMEERSAGKTESAFAWVEMARATEPLERMVQEAKLQDFPVATERWSLDQVRSALPAGAFLVEYCVVDDRTYVWILWHDGWEQLTLPVGDAQIRRWADTLREAAATRDDGGIRNVLEASFDGLIREPLRRILTKPHQRIVFLPDGAMYGLPFNALRDQQAAEYLVEKIPVSVASSATHYALSVLRDSGLAQGKSILLVENPAFDRSLDVARGLEPVPHAREQIDAIAEIYGPRARRLSPRESTVERFFDGAARSAIVHFTGHAVPSAEMTFNSVLLFAPSARHSGALTADELLTRLRLTGTRLAVLSACSTAGGSTLAQEHMAPLARSIVAAGVPGVIGTLWDVGPNDPIGDLLTRFHRHYHAGEAADVALQSAQTEMLHLNSSAFNSVGVWGGFQMIGYASSPFEKKK